MTKSGKVYIDFETRSRIDLKKAGSWAYAQHPSTSILCLGYAIDDTDVQVLPEHTLYKWSYLTEWLYELAEDPEILFVAHNAFFEQMIWQFIMVKRYGMPEIPRTRWRCTLAKAVSHALPADLFSCSRALGLSTVKDDEGYRLMLKMSKPRKASKARPNGGWWEEPDQIRRLCDYNKTDVITERLLDNTLRDLNPLEQELWFLDQEINERGIQIDLPTVNRILGMIEECKHSLSEEFKQITDGYCGPAQVARTKEWVEAQGYPLPDLTKGTVEEELKNGLPENVKRVLEIRQQLSKSSTAKFTKMVAKTDSAGILRETLAFHAASTGRWSGRGVQLHNLPVGTVNSEVCIDFLTNSTGEFDWFNFLYPDAMGAFSSCIRGMIIAREEHKLLVGDYNAIEARVVAWLADEPLLLKLFRDKKDPYVWMASMIFDKLIEEVTKDERRRFGKPSVLGCGYQMGPDRFASQYGVDIGLAERCVDTYRTNFPAIKRFWYNMEAAAIRAVVTGRRQCVGKLTWFVDKDFLHCKLPSGRCLSYYKPRIQTIETKWGTEKEALTFMGVDTKTKQWMRQSTYGGMLVENVTQAVARDIMAEAMLRCEKAGYPIILTVHDELVAEVLQRLEEKSLDEFIGLMSVVPDWAFGLPITVEGWEGTRYRK